MSAPHPSERAAIGELPRYLEEANALCAARAGALDAPPGAFKGISSEFDELRWFWLPEICLEEPPDGRGSQSTPVADTSES